MEFIIIIFAFSVAGIVYRIYSGCLKKEIQNAEYIYNNSDSVQEYLIECERCNITGQVIRKVLRKKGH